ncbi:hypothetical protein SLEP1_g51758 [Rubroshorea leprosula]|uniref:Uncharacterized protein n=1 Tax=Rubroshorea leprosula TaxID=152421 RepID=A0AAV5M5S4_9ROSI|nr:hypothetical protein SLEP1_g51758 [Rubroshorea leprosula]
MKRLAEKFPEFQRKHTRLSSQNYQYASVMYLTNLDFVSGVQAVLLTRLLGKKLSRS